ncbi:hypothetical protein GYMLUDRAFT_76875 [Collybiopsis luxurians FD-317 M1]|uniref:Uncharacterized protein n=1 Tax=Collybiopsis luxurians FD-317 M1 TaxID=944289 RepID=A0A0D0C9N4_9AGAR|nr:hypothetical protein GYMLUDRAFT_76875 [Collybiopsis luxurians FD-317 M1]
MVTGTKPILPLDIVELMWYEQEYQNVIKIYDFKPGQLVQMQNSTIEKSLDQKMYLRYRGLVVYKEKVAAWQLLPHYKRYEPIELPENIHELIDLSPEQLEHMVNNEELDSDLAFDSMPALQSPMDDLGVDKWLEMDKGSINEEDDSESDDEGEEVHIMHSHSK